MMKEDIYAISALAFMSKLSRERRLVADEYIKKYGEPPYIIDKASFFNEDLEDLKKDVYCNFNFLVHCLFSTYKNADIIVNDKFLFEQVSAICKHSDDLFFWKSDQNKNGGFYKVYAKKFFQIRVLSRSIIETKRFSDFDFYLPKIEDAVNFDEFIPISNFDDYF